MASQFANSSVNDANSQPENGFWLRVKQEQIQAFLAYQKLISRSFTWRDSDYRTFI